MCMNAVQPAETSTETYSAKHFLLFSWSFGIENFGRAIVVKI